MAYPNKYKPKHIAILSFCASLMSAAAFWGVSLTSQSYIGGFRPYALEQAQAGYQIDHGKSPIQSRGLYLIMMGGSLGLAGLILCASDDEGNSLINLQSNALRQDIAETVEITGGLFNDAFGAAIAGGLSWAVLSGKKTAKQVFVLTAPEALKDKLAEQYGQATWFDEFLASPHVWLVGKTRSGKTILLFKLILNFIEKYPQGTFTICDLNYGKPDEDGYINDWMGLPENPYIRSEYEDIKQTIEEEWQELQRRRQLCKEASRQGKVKIDLDWRMLIIEEQPGVMAQAIRQKELDDVKLWLSDLLFQGAGYRLKILFVSQSLKVNATEINIAQRDQLCFAILGQTALKKDEVSQLPGAEPDKLIAKLKEARKRYKYSCIVQMREGDPAVRNIPDLRTVGQTRLLTKAPEDENLAWWQSIWTPQKKQWLDDLAYRFVAGEIKSPLKEEVCRGFGIAYGPRSPRYVAFVADAWKDAVERAKQQLEKDEE